MSTTVQCPMFWDQEQQLLVSGISCAIYVVLNILCSHCSVAISSLSQSECSPSNTEPSTNSTSTSTTENSVTTVDTPTGYDFFSTTTGIVGGVVVATVLIIVVAIIIIIVALLVLKKAGKKYAALTNEAKKFRIFNILCCRYRAPIPTSPNEAYWKVVVRGREGGYEMVELSHRDPPTKLSPPPPAPTQPLPTIPLPPTAEAEEDNVYDVITGEQ